MKRNSVRLLSLRGLAFGLSLLGLPAAASAISLGFTCISHNHVSSCLAGENQLRLDIAPVGEAASFTFSNVGDVNSVISQIYIDDNSGSILNLLSMGTSSVGTVRFQAGARPTNLPAGNPVNFDADVSFGALNPSPKNGINNALSDNEWLSLTYRIGVTYDELLTAMIKGDLRFGLHVQGFKHSSESFINKPPVSAVPVPAAVWLLGSGLVGLTLVARRRNHLKK